MKKILILFYIFDTNLHISNLYSHVKHIISLVIKTKNKELIGWNKGKHNANKEKKTLTKV